MVKICFVTYATRPEPSASDALVAAWLREQGHEVFGVPWTDAPDAFSDADLLVIRSTWDYPLHPERFSAWLEAIDGRWPVANPVELVRWNMHKRYLLDLGQQGVRVPRSAVLESVEEVEAYFDAWSTAELVIKPLVGASGRGVVKVQPGAELSALAAGQYLVQEFVGEIADGELSLAFFGGRYSHAVIKHPSAGEFRINSAYGGQVSPTDPPPQAIATAEGVVASLTPDALYARVDGVMVRGEFVLFELELIEPSFFFVAQPQAAQHFGRAIIQRVRQGR
ncbi:MAG: ATP-grasp domain-containing protein [Pseudomonadota bacterium]